MSRRSGELCWRLQEQRWRGRSRSRGCRGSTKGRSTVSNEHVQQPEPVKARKNLRLWQVSLPVHTSPHTQYTLSCRGFWRGRLRRRWGRG
jgi:hypothetical protein